MFSYSYYIIYKFVLLPSKIYIYIYMRKLNYICVSYYNLFSLLVKKITEIRMFWISYLSDYISAYIYKLYLISYAVYKNLKSSYTIN